MFYFSLNRTHFIWKSLNERLTWRGMHKTNKTKDKEYYGQIEFVSLFPITFFSFTLKRGRIEIGRFKPPASYFLSLQFLDYSKFRFPNSPFFILGKPSIHPRLETRFDAIEQFEKVMAFFETARYCSVNQRLNK